jgi:hypothetical protein
MKKALIIMAVIIAFIWIKIKSDNLDANKFWNDAITPKEDNTLKNAREKSVREGYVKVILRNHIGISATVILKGNGKAHKKSLGPTEITSIEIPQGDYTGYFYNHNDRSNHIKISGLGKTRDYTVMEIKLTMSTPFSK